MKKIISIFLLFFLAVKCNAVSSKKKDTGLSLFGASCNEKLGSKQAKDLQSKPKTQERIERCLRGNNDLALKGKNIKDPKFIAAFANTHCKIPTKNASKTLLNVSLAQTNGFIKWKLKNCHIAYKIYEKYKNKFTANTKSLITPTAIQGAKNISQFWTKNKSEINEELEVIE